LKFSDIEKKARLAQRQTKMGLKINYGQGMRVCLAKHTLSKHTYRSDLAMRERFTHACNSNQLIILASKEGNLPRHTAVGGEVKGDWAKKKG
jgi:hypothetical protein